ncbi:serine protease [Vibrio sp. 1865]|uniref:S1 family peptidase n=1 Tax=unclassified Vibrio TaxID=2614977 RepID=UPI002964154F|nr:MULTISPECIES: serine protease [unclassified Vibrio]MDW2090383.1 serine protease [Vibrio sp. 1866]MDW3100056.1 serine protease [Vibrio sp. 1874]MDW3198141.1 serine protease [Vibrio sp. 1865]
MKQYQIWLSALCFAVSLSTTAEVENDNRLSEQGISTAIIGGQQATQNQLPFFARLILHKTGANQFANICGGTIVNDRFILTAAHCVEPSVFTDGWTINDLRVLVKNPTMNDVFVEEFKDVRSITIHPDYVPSDLWINDIAVLELTRPITDNVQSITLPQDFGDYSSKSVYQIFGLGQTSTNDESPPNYLRWAEVKPLTDTQCVSLVTGFNAQESLCANGFPERSYTGICRGDSGGPLTYKDNNGMYQQIGIVSYGSSVCESAAIPSVFTEILNYATWIETQTSSGVKTSYNALLASSEDYHSEGDSGFEPVDTNTSGFGNNGSSGGGALGSGLIMLGGWFGWLRHRRNYSRS